MPRLLISKKGRTPLPALIVGLLSIVTSVAFFATGLTKSRFGDSDFEKFAKGAAPVLILFAGLLLLMGAFAYAKTCINVYDDHIEGVGVAKGALRTQRFYFDRSMHYTVQQSGSNVSVSCNGMSYSVSLSAQDAQEVYRCVNGGGSASYSGSASAQSRWQSPPPPPRPDPQPEAGGTRIVWCPHCAAKARVPLGKGKIRITCPNPACGKSFEFTT